MSADNWTECPKCGTPSKEYKESEQVLREDWEIGIYKGEFYSIYKGDCSRCDFVFEFRYEEKLTPKSEK